MRMRQTVMGDHTLWVWRVNDWRLVDVISSHAQRVSALVKESSGRVFSASIEGSVKMWSRLAGSENGNKVRHSFVHLLNPPSAVNALACSSTDLNNLYAGLADGSLRFWQEISGRYRSLVLDYRHRSAVSCVAASGENAFSGSVNGIIRIWRREPVGATWY